ncbi:MAG: hypothetical protein GX130_14020 [Candidatus Hydrogenedens sp.]|jgi:hypothetical protein|nr:hypothetical protein [Candidatus Hydrogenedens sp.]
MTTNNITFKHISLLICLFTVLMTAFHTPRAEAFGGPLVRKIISGGVRKGVQKSTQKGVQKGIQKGTQKGLQKGTQKGLQKGAQKGIQKGVQKGLGQAAKGTGLSSSVTKAVQTLPKTQQTRALHVLQRSSPAMHQSVEKYGARVLTAEMKHPGVGGKLVTSFGPESFGILDKASTGQVIRFTRHSNKLEALTPSARSQLFSKAAQGPEKVLTALEKHPNIINACKTLGITGIIVAGGTKVGSQALRGEIETIHPDGTVTKEMGPISLNVEKVAESLENPLMVFGGILAGGLSLAWFIHHRPRKRNTVTTTASTQEELEQRP